MQYKKSYDSREKLFKNRIFNVFYYGKLKWVWPDTKFSRFFNSFDVTEYNETFFLAMPLFPRTSDSQLIVELKQQLSILITSKTKPLETWKSHRGLNLTRQRSLKVIQRKHRVAAYFRNIPTNHWVLDQHSSPEFESQIPLSGGWTSKSLKGVTKRLNLRFKWCLLKCTALRQYSSQFVLSYRSTVLIQIKSMAALS